MKLKVISVFCDKHDHVTLYKPDMVLEVKDKKRAQSLIDRGLCKVFKGKSAHEYVLDEPESNDKETSTDSQSMKQ
jgi:hypothetical protein